MRLTGLDVAKRQPADPAAKKTCVITGASSGIGLATAAALSRTGWRVVCAVRDTNKMEKAIAQLGEVGPGSLEVAELDLASFASVKTFAAKLLAREDVPRIDALVLNAGMVNPSWSLTKDGYETTFQTCHLSHHLLVKLLETKLIESAPSRVVVVSSAVHSLVSSYDWPKENHKGFRCDSASEYSALSQYAQNKVANLHFALVLSQRLKGKGVTVTSLHPGVVNSSIWPWWLVGRSLFMISNEQGAATSVYAVTDPQFAAKDYPGGTFWQPAVMGDPYEGKQTSFARDQSVAERLWKETETILAPFLA